VAQACGEWAAWAASRGRGMRARGKERGGRAWAGFGPAEREWAFFFLFPFLFLNPFSPLNKYSSKFLGCQNEIFYVKCH
jgi:hypothetical protein